MGVRGQAERGGEVALRRRMVCEEAETPDAYKEDSWKVLERKKIITREISRHLRGSREPVANR